MLYNLKEKRRGWKLKEQAPDRIPWRSRFQRRYAPILRPKKSVVVPQRIKLFLQRLFTDKRRESQSAQ
jgi:hypothetical protein